MRLISRVFYNPLNINNMLRIKSGYITVDISADDKLGKCGKPPLSLGVGLGRFTVKRESVGCLSGHQTARRSANAQERFWDTFANYAK